MRSCPGGISRQRVPLLILALVVSAKRRIGDAAFGLFDEPPPRLTLLLRGGVAVDRLDGDAHLPVRAVGPEGHAQCDDAVRAGPGCEFDAGHSLHCIIDCGPFRRWRAHPSAPRFGKLEHARSSGVTIGRSCRAPKYSCAGYS